MKRPRLPTTLRLLPGLKWRGKLSLFEARGEGAERRYSVGFDAVAPRADPAERYVFDRAVLTAKQLRDWTGWEEP